MYSINTWCWTLFVLYIGTRFLDFANKRLVYGQETVLPSYLLHHPVIITCAFFVVQWDASAKLGTGAGIMLKLLVVVLLVYVLWRLLVRRQATPPPGEGQAPGNLAVAGLALALGL
jgi:hypothetical protein